MKRRGRKTTPEEQDLWQRAYGKPKRSISKAPAPPEMPVPQPNLPPSSLSGFDRVPDPPQILRPYSGPDSGFSLPKSDPARPSGLDRATETRLRRGKRQPDATLDLHGMTANRAHAALIRFVGKSRMAGHRMILVVTGKGAFGAPRAFGDHAPGILRRETPVWLSTPPLSDQIVNVSQAHPRHGGSGALYVYLRKIR
jgi:DNA-nicking Smr family endonuclease